jgi:hypothetical protein
MCNSWQVYLMQHYVIKVCQWHIMWMNSCKGNFLNVFWKKNSQISLLESLVSGNIAVSEKIFYNVSAIFVILNHGCRFPNLLWKYETDWNQALHKHKFIIPFWFSEKHGRHGKFILIGWNFQNLWNNTSNWFAV